MNESQSSVRIGPISLFALIAVICLATLAVLSIATSNATYRLTTLQADSMAQQYQAETAAQTFVARIDAGYADATVTAERAAAQKAAAEKAAAELDGSTITAQFTCPSGRVLDIELELGSGGTYRITKWNMTAKVNSAETDTLWSGM